LKDLASKIRYEFQDNFFITDEILLLLNGCRTGCLKSENFVVPGCEKMVYVAGMSVDGLETEESNLSETVISAVRVLYSQ